jgi:hypothetical protein|tara:strand:+ start:5745 stop:6056 length:312 start_codon:yes stop_codon:yes gene_type:complete
VKTLKDVATVIRSKNAGPYELTFDVLFPDITTYERVVESGVVNAQSVSQLYGIPLEDVKGIIHFAPALAIKVTIKRPRVSGNLGESDVYGAQQHAPFLTLAIN